MANEQTAIPELSRCAGALTLELELPAPDSVPPAPLSRTVAADVAAAIAADLDRILPGVAELGLVIPGALYDQTELLRPGFPLMDTLESLFRGSLLNAGFVPQLMALGSDDGRFPVAALNPERRPGSGPLLLLPFCFVGPRAAIHRLSATMENVLLQQGSVSPATGQVVQQAFRLRTPHLSYATVSDLCALLQVQLEQAGFGGLWQLLEQSLFQRDGVCRVQPDSGNLYLLAGQSVYVPFYTFDDWAQTGPGRDLAGEQLAAGYAAWSRQHRQYVMGLTAHGVPVRLVLGQPALWQEDAAAALAAAERALTLDGATLVETVNPPPGGNPPLHWLITHQFLPEVGTLAYTVAMLAADGEQVGLAHHYPLWPEGVPAIIRDLRQRSAELGISYRVLHPPALAYSPIERCLLSAAEPPSKAAAVH